MQKTLEAIFKERIEITSNEISLLQNWSVRRWNNDTYRKLHTPLSLYNQLISKEVIFNLFKKGVIINYCTSIDKIFYEPERKYPQNFAIDITEQINTDEDFRNIVRNFDEENEIYILQTTKEELTRTFTKTYLVLPWTKKFIEGIYIMTSDTEISEAFYIPGESYKYYTKKQIQEFLDKDIDGPDVFEINCKISEKSGNYRRLENPIIAIGYPNNILSDKSDEILLTGIKRLINYHDLLDDWIYDSDFDTSKEIFLNRLNPVLAKYTTSQEKENYRNIIKFITMKSTIHTVIDSISFEGFMTNFYKSMEDSENSYTLIFFRLNTYQDGEELSRYRIKTISDFTHDNVLITITDSKLFNSPNDDVYVVGEEWLKEKSFENSLKTERLIKYLYSAIELLADEDIINYNLLKSLTDKLGMTTEDFKFLFKEYDCPTDDEEIINEEENE